MERAHSSGHFHVEFAPEEDDSPDAEGDCVNDTFEVVAQAITERDDEILGLYFVCAFGCGMPHPLTEQELKTLKVRQLGEKLEDHRPTFERIT